LEGMPLIYGIDSGDGRPLATRRDRPSRPHRQARHFAGGARSGIAHAAQAIEELKKSAMAAPSEKLLAGTGWLPEILRPHAG
jgi:hypothetical protein